jgi:hypothetical protein
MSEILNDFENAIKQDLEGKTLFVMVTSVSASGMSRTMRVFTSNGINDLVEVTHSVSSVLGLSKTDKGLRIRGCGMDMTFALVNDLNHTLGLSLKREIL